MYLSSLHRLGGSTHVDATLTPTARDKLNLRVARQNVTSAGRTVMGTPSSATTVHDHPGCPSMPTRRTRPRCARDPSHPAGLPAQRTSTEDRLVLGRQQGGAASIGSYLRIGFLTVSPGSD